MADFIWEIFPSLSMSKVEKQKKRGGLTWENSRHLATLSLVSPPSDVLETSAEIPYWCRVTTQIWVVTRHHYAISALVSQISLGGETSGSVAKCRLFLRLVEGWSISRYVDCGTLCSVLRMDTRFHLVPKVLSYSNHRKYNQSAFTFDTFGYVSLTCLDFFQIYDLLFLLWTELWKDLESWVQSTKQETSCTIRCHKFHSCLSSWEQVTCACLLNDFTSR